MDQTWLSFVVELIDDAIPKVIRYGFLKEGTLKTNEGKITFLRGMSSDGQPVFGAACQNVLPYDVKIAIGAGRRRAALALVHELLHCVDYKRGQVMEHTFLHNIAAMIESEIIQKMKGYYGR